MVFDAYPDSQDYPRKLRDARLALRMSQNDFAEAAGYSGVMQGRYETDRSKKNSAIPSERTAKAIKRMIESASESARRMESPVPAPALDEAPLHATRSLKSITAHEIEQAIASAISALTGTRCGVVVNDIAWVGGDASHAAISLTVGA